jgi:hypothetical protein
MDRRLGRPLEPVWTRCRREKFPASTGNGTPIIRSSSRDASRPYRLASRLMLGNRKFHNGLHYLCSIHRVITWVWMRRTSKVVRLGSERNAYKILITKPEMKTSLWRLVDGTIIWKWTLKEYILKIWTTLSWFWIANNNNLLWILWLGS